MAQLASSWVRSTRNPSTSVEQERAFHSTERQLKVSCADAPGLKQAGPPGVLVHNTGGLCNAEFLEQLGISKGDLRVDARSLFATRIGYPVSELGMDVHHVIPLEWAHLFPSMHPNDLRNIAAVDSIIHSRVTVAWNDQRGQASLIGASACDRTCWRPRGRMVDSRLRRVAIDFTQASSPRGRPR